MPTHTETKLLPYTADQMYALVADVARYPEFLPWNAAARIRSRRPGADGSEVMEADLVISFKVFRERFGSQVVLWPAQKRIETRYLDGPFRHMESTWAFVDRPDLAGVGGGGGCEVRFHVDFEFRNAILQGVIGVVFNDAMQRVVRAFERRAAALHGTPGQSGVRQG
jgi:coenzyme Q-binding protein COQ10